MVLVACTWRDLEYVLADNKHLKVIIIMVCMHTDVVLELVNSDIDKLSQVRGKRGLGFTHLTKLSSDHKKPQNNHYCDSHTG